MEKVMPAWAAKIAAIMKKNPKGQPIDEHGKFYGSPIPIEPPLGYKRQPSLAEQMRQLIRSEALAAAARSQGYETLEEGDDFDVQDDYDPRSPWEYNFDPVVDPQALEAATKPPPPPAPSPNAEGAQGAGGGSPQPAPAEHAPPAPA